MTRATPAPPLQNGAAEGRNAQGQWIFVETLGEEPLVVAVGDRPKRLVPLRSVLRRNPNSALLSSLLSDMRQLQGSPQALALRGGRVAHVRPLLVPDGTCHGAQFWIGERDQSPPERPLAGAFMWDLNTHETTNDDEFFQAVDMAHLRANAGVTIAEFLAHVEHFPDEAEGLGYAAGAPAGATYASTRTRMSEDGRGTRWRLADRRVDELDESGVLHRRLRGVCVNIGPAQEHEVASITIAQRVSAAERVPGEHRALVNLWSMHIWRWWDDPLPGPVWRHEPGNPPQIHPEDLPAAKALRAALAHGEAAGTLRLRAEGGGWIAVRVTANSVGSGYLTNAALVSFSLPQARP